jgi:AcrR family transcriptional regulator
MLRADAQRNLERLKAAALEVFREGGLRSPLDEVARRAGVSVGTLYNRFGSREALIDAVLADLVRTNVEHIRHAAHETADPWERVERFFNGLLEMQVADPALNEAVTRAHAETPGLAAACEQALSDGAALLHEAGVRDSLPGPDIVAAFLTANAAIVAHNGANTARRMLAALLAGLKPN